MIKTRGRLPLLLLLVLSSMVSSCATCATQLDAHLYPHFRGPYGGTLANARRYMCYWEHPEYILREGDMDFLRVFKLPLLILDTPLSLIADTLILPITIFQESRVPPFSSHCFD